MAVRQAFTPPADEEDDILSMLAGAPATKPTVPSAAVAPPAPVRTPAGPAPVQLEAKAADPVAPVTPSTAGAKSKPLKPKGLDATVPAAEAEPAKPAGGKRIGLYVNTSRWLWLKRLSVERAEKGLPSDFTSIFLEAVDEKYPR